MAGGADVTRPADGNVDNKINLSFLFREQGRERCSSFEVSVLDDANQFE